ncbi:hypothetical protein [Marinoscillum pacificum]|uniref:hypothetical protein n=1 Tax=Marinoscillum pacificum TaxID=392723 RepID=UPI002157EC8B|nr:hypothetical protein [Marinoscillum pacificum]
MAQLQNNLFLQGARGMLGKQLVYKTVGGKLIVSTRPVRSGEATEAQKQQNTRFRYASFYAKKAIKDPILGPIYESAVKRLSKFNSAYQLALTDYLKTPEIGDISIASITSGSMVLVEAFKDPELNKVEVAILAKNKSVIAAGEATPTINGIQWEFELPVDIPEGGKLEVKAFDLPGNVETKTFDVEL